MMQAYSKKFQSSPNPGKLLKLGHYLSLHSLAEEAAKVIADCEIPAISVFLWYDLLVRTGSTAGLNLFSKSKVRALQI
jgi:hypothetical protein